MSKVFLDEMNWHEASEAIERGAPIFLPIGPIEGHGTHVPLGCDYYVATAVAKLMAERLLPVVKALGEYVQWLDEENPRDWIK